MGEADHPAPEVEDRPEVVACVPGAAADARVDGPGGRLPWDRVTRDIFLLPQFAPCFPLCVAPHTVDSLAGSNEPSGQLVSPFVACGRRGGWYFERSGLLSPGICPSGTESTGGLFEATVRRGHDDSTAVGLAFYRCDLVSHAGVSVLSIAGARSFVTTLRWKCLFGAKLPPICSASEAS